MSSISGVSGNVNPLTFMGAKQANAPTDLVDSTMRASEGSGSESSAGSEGDMGAESTFSTLA